MTIEGVLGRERVEDRDLAARPDLVDGRRLRRDQNRRAVLEALLQLFREGVYDPSAGLIAQRAGLSPRSLFRYFDDVDDLHRAAIDQQLQQALPLVPVGATPADPTPRKAAALAAQRVALFETIRPAALALRSCAHRHPLLAGQLHGSRSYLRHQVEELLAPELQDRPALAAAIDSLCSFESYELLRTEHGLDGPAVADTLAEAVTRLLDPGTPPR